MLAIFVARQHAVGLYLQIAIFFYKFRPSLSNAVIVSKRIDVSSHLSDDLVEAFF